MTCLRASLALPGCLKVGVKLPDGGVGIGLNRRLILLAPCNRTDARLTWPNVSTLDSLHDRPLHKYSRPVPEGDEHSFVGNMCLLRRMVFLPGAGVTAGTVKMAVWFGERFRSASLSASRWASGLSLLLLVGPCSSRTALVCSSGGVIIFEAKVRSPPRQDRCSEQMQGGMFLFVARGATRPKDEGLDLDSRNYMYTTVQMAQRLPFPPLAPHSPSLEAASSWTPLSSEPSSPNAFSVFSCKYASNLPWRLSCMAFPASFCHPFS